MGVERRVCCAALLVHALCIPAAAEVEFHLGSAQINLGANLHTLTGLQQYRLHSGPLELNESTGLHSAIARLEWALPLTHRWQVEIHQRLSWLALSGVLGLPGAGSGITPEPQRSIDLRSVLVEESGVVLDHDIDRAALHHFGRGFDLVLGRQGITWGTSQIFPVADLWAGFSPYDLDTTQKRGVDALRAMTSIGERLELEAVVADRGTRKELSAGLRLTYYADLADIYLAPGRFWDRLGLAGGVSLARSTWLLRGESVVLKKSSEAAVLRATLGADWFIGGDLIWTWEAHWNGDGANEDENLTLFVADSAPLQRGETFLLGRQYAGTALLWQLHPILALSASGLANWADPSALLSVAAGYEPTQGAHISLGSFWGLGDKPELDPRPQLMSEYGSYGRLFYLQVSIYV